MQKEEKIVSCTDCQHAGNNDHGNYICYNMKSMFWFLNVLNLRCECPCFLRLVEGCETMRPIHPSRIEAFKEQLYKHQKINALIEEGKDVDSELTKNFITFKIGHNL